MPNAGPHEHYKTPPKGELTLATKDLLYTQLCLPAMGRFSLLALLPWIALALAFPRPLMNALTSRDGRVQAGARLSRRAAAPPTDQFPYGGAKIDGLPGSQKGGFQVPAPGDTAHQFQPPAAGAIRGPCPGLNTMANHAFISPDGITTFDELVAAQQNVSTSCHCRHSAQSHCP